MSLQNDRVPNWGVWRLRKPTIWQAVALSLNIDPDYVRHSYAEMYQGHFFDEGQEFLDRLEIARDNYSEIMGLPPRPIKASDEAPINLPLFAQWARTVAQWEMPAELEALFPQNVGDSPDETPKPPAQDQVQPPAEVQKPTAQRSSTSRDDQDFQSWAKELAESRDGQGPSRDEATRWAAARGISRAWAREAVVKLPAEIRQKPGNLKPSNKP